MAKIGPKLTADTVHFRRAAVRDNLIELVAIELVGPSSEHEILAANPQKRYVCGQLAPIREEDDDELLFEAESLSSASESDLGTIGHDVDESAAEDNLEGDVNDESAKESSSIGAARRESLTSIGISFAVEVGQKLSYTARWGQYEKSSDGNYSRTSHHVTGDLIIDGITPLTSRRHDRASISWVVRASAGRMIGSIFLGNVSPFTTRDGTDRLYQVELELSCAAETTGFLTRSAPKSVSFDPNDLLYRDRQEYGVGLNVAVEPEFDQTHKCISLKSRTLPIVQTRVTQSRDSGGDPDALNMAWLAEKRDPKITCDKLSLLFDEYRAWVLDLEAESGTLLNRYKPLASAQLIKIRARIERIESGIQTLRTVPVAFEAFRFANECMARAQFRNRNRQAMGVPMSDSDRDGSWRPFQIAFLVSSVPEIVFPEIAERQIVDVLFFPTGGGKTEAYLGLSAFTMGFRRMSPRYPNAGAGISTLMRYTLRLLTTQQFSRAATLICAAESVRRDATFEQRLGRHPFSIGLWVGPMTPNRYAEAVTALKASRGEHMQCARDCALSREQRDFPPKSLKGRETANVLPITECPWCFSAICIDCVDLDDNAKRLIIRCPNEACSYSKPNSSDGLQVDGLPVFVVDEDVYRISPTIVVATVDKFATLPFKGEAKSLFGNVSSYCEDCGFLTDAIEHRSGHKDRVSKIERNSPADLIIQDELHTITDNLGSIYGLYEAAIDYLMTEKGIGPKYICATATVKDVASQIRALYGQRPAEVFPPTGLVAGDTFFSRDVLPTDDEPGRTYVGIYAPAFSRLSLFVAVLSSLLAGANRCRELFGEKSSDPYMTLLGYFNTVRDLGAVKALLGDDVPPVLEEIATRNGWHRRKLVDWESELTGRIAANEVPDRLKTLSTAYTPENGCDFMAATNMISVGVDVPRLGVMLVDGQPKSTSEYIQSTSRVGRSHPGVVFVVFNSMRPRDVSHYEHFYSYHDGLYKFVEAGSITPFSDGAVDRYLRAAIVACFRMQSRLSENDDASSFAADPDGIVAAILSAFVKRAEPFGPHEIKSTTTAIEELVQSWRAAPKDLAYYASSSNRWKGKNAIPKKPTIKKHTVLKAADEPTLDSIETLFTAARSMRNVEAEVPLLVLLDA